MRLILLQSDMSSDECLLVKVPSEGVVMGAASLGSGGGVEAEGVSARYNRGGRVLREMDPF